MDFDVKGCLGEVRGVFLSVEEKVSQKNNKYHTIKIGNPANFSNVSLFLDSPVYERALKFEKGESVVLQLDLQPRGLFCNPVCIDIEKVV